MTAPESPLILDLISFGQANAKHGSELAPLLGMENRDFRRQLEQLRRQGVVIIGDVRNGYYRPANLYELECYIHQEEHRARSILYTLRSARLLRNQWTQREGMDNITFFE